MRIDVLTLFPEMFEGPFKASIIGRAVEAGAVEIHVHNFRECARDKHHTVDDAPFGGGPGMVLKPEPIFDAVEKVRSGGGQRGPLIYLTPKGRQFTQSMARDLSSLGGFILLCGRYEGVDQRVIDHLVDLELSIGDYVLSGGEPAALVVADAVVRLLPGALGDEASTLEESFSDGLLEYPHYTRPAVYRDFEVPPVLVSGNHEAIRQWRKEQSINITNSRRPDLVRRTHTLEARNENG